MRCASAVRAWLALTLWAGVLSASTPAGEESGVQSATGADDGVDISPAFRVGRIEISRYALEKNRRRFVQATSEQEGRPPTAAELEHWQKLFRRQQVLLADADAAGYFARPEIARLVTAAERYMLTQPNGPYYASMYRRAEPDEKRLRSIDALTRKIVRGLGVCFDTTADARAALGPDFDSLPDDEKRARVRRARNNPRAIFREGEMTWPCEPFPAAAEAILALGTGEILRQEHGAGGVLYFFAQETTVQPAAAFAAIRESLAAFVRECDRRQVQREHGTSALSSARFSWDAHIAARVFEQGHGHVLPEGRLDTTALSSLVAETLGRYVLRDGTAVAISVGDWVTWFNAQFLRALPGSTRQVGDLVASMALQELDFHAARAAGLDRTPRFTEDRKNFTRNQVLDAYEREKIAPLIHITDAAVEADYATRRAQFRRVIRVHARQLVFADTAAAADYLACRQAPEGAGGASPVAPPLRENEIIVTRPSADSIDAGFDLMFIASPVGCVFGPREMAEGAELLIRGPDADAAPAPLVEVAGGIRQRLERKALEAEELRLGEELAHVYPLEETNEASASRFAATQPKTISR
jgi:hypothetical protein